MTDQPGVPLWQRLRPDFQAPEFDTESELDDSTDDTEETDNR